MKPILNLFLVFSIFLIVSLLSGQPRLIEAVEANESHLSKTSANLAAPVLKWAYKGCYSSWCETGWYSSPAVADLNGDGKMEVIGAAYSIFVLDGATGELNWRISSGHDRSEPSAGNVGRTWPGVVVADLDGDGQMEIVTAHSGGYVSVYDSQGYFKPGWPQRPTPNNELRSLGVYDLDRDGNLEVMAASTRSDDQWFVFEHDGSLRAGEWPQHGPDSDVNGYAAGCFNQNLAAGDLTGDGLAEIIGPNDTHYIAAFDANGSQVRASSIYGLIAGSPKFWSRVGVHVDHAVDLRGYAHCGIEHRPNFANSAPVIIDVNGDGINEVVVIGNVYNCAGTYTDLYEIPYIFNADRTRWQADGYDWTVLPTPPSGAAPLSQDYTLVESNLPNPVVVDLDGDGKMEIVFPSYDGRMHAYWLDKTQHGNWPYAVTKPGEGLIRFASEPVVADLNGDGKAEVIFASWVEKGTFQTGKLHILNYLGEPIWEVDLPAAFGGANWNGALAAPTLANIDEDADLEIVLNTAHSGLVAYDLPGTAGARILWGTGRGNYQRSGSLLYGDLSGSRKYVDQLAPKAGETLTYTMQLISVGLPMAGVTLTDQLPVGISFLGGLQASAGTATYADGIVSWTGDVIPGTPVTVSFQALVSPALEGAVTIANQGIIDDGEGRTWVLQAVVVVNGRLSYLPVLVR
jgi:uncharacterized repeat protein (TIGR01451 family)